MSRKKIILGTLILGIFLAVLIFVFNTKIKHSIFYTFPCDVSRRLTSPRMFETIQYSERIKTPPRTALLVRAYGFDFNFLLYVTDKWDVNPSCNWQRPLWISKDYNPSTDLNFHEDLEWSKDATVIAVIIEEEYVFAYDFTFSREYNNAGEIRELFESRSKKP